MIARIVAFSVHQRWLVVMLSFAACLLGLWSLSKLPIDAVPDITNNQVQINTSVPSLSTIDIEKQVTFPIETSLSGIKGLEYTRSLSRNGFSQVTAVFTDKTDIYFARQQVNERLAEAEQQFPAGVKPKTGPISSGLGEIYMWSVRFKKVKDEHNLSGVGWQSDGGYLTPEGQKLKTDDEKASYLRTLQDWTIKPQLKNITGVAGIDVIGGFEKQYVIQPDLPKLISLNLSFNDIAEAVERNNNNRGAGYIEHNGEGLSVRATGRLESLEEISSVVIANKGGVQIKLSDVAEVVIGRELRTGSASENGTEVVIGTAMMLIGENSRTVSAAVDAKMKEINKRLPDGIEAVTVLNRSQLVDATVKTVSKNLAEGALLVILILFLMLGNFRAALVTALVIPIAMLMTFTGMLQGKISANLMSLGALDFGLIVDGAVIIVENTLRRLAEKQHGGHRLTLEDRLSSVIAASEEMIKPSIYGQAIIILVYVPLLTFTGIEGKMFEPMALTVIFALVAAFVLSLTFIPAMISITITGNVTEKDNFIMRCFNQIYAPVLTKSLRHPFTIMFFSILFLVVSFSLFSRLGQEFIPTLDEKNIAMHALKIPSVSLTQSQKMQLDVEKTVKSIDEVAFVFSKTGTAEVAADPMPPNASDTFIILKPQSEWKNSNKSKEDLILDIKDKVESLVGNNYEFTQPIQMRFNELLAGVRGDLSVKIFGDDFEKMLKAANQISNVLKNTKGAVDVKVEQISGLPIFEIKINKTEIARLGMTTFAIQEVIGAAIGGKAAGFIFEGDKRFPIIIRLSETIKEDIDKIKNLPIPLPTENNKRPQYVPLQQLATVTTVEGMNQISRENGKRRVVVTANIRGRDIASVVSEAQEGVEKIQLPVGYHIIWGGQFENLEAARSRLMVVVPACFFLIFLLLLSALGSVRDSLIVFTAVPFALTGGILALYLRNMPFSVAAAVGFIALSGIAVLNGLVMLTYIKQLIHEGLNRSDALILGAMTRLRPVIMTALVASLGFMPMAIGSGTGAEVQKPLATVVIGGLITATLLTLVVLPLLYFKFGSIFTKK